jgi:hypothetical protein
MPPPSESFDAIAFVNNRVDGLERRVDVMDAKLTKNVQRASDTHHAVATMTESFRAMRNALYGAAAAIVAAAVLVIILGQHP